MARQCCLVIWPLTLGGLLAAAGPALAQTRPAVAYSLPADGTWAEYELKGGKPDQPLSGTLRLACVGSREVNGVKHR
jgi:hypothetical protein